MACPVLTTWEAVVNERPPQAARGPSFKVCWCFQVSSACLLICHPEIRRGVFVSQVCFATSSNGRGVRGQQPPHPPHPSYLDSQSRLWPRLPPPPLLLSPGVRACSCTAVLAVRVPPGVDSRPSLARPSPGLGAPQGSLPLQCEHLARGWAHRCSKKFFSFLFWNNELFFLHGAIRHLLCVPYLYPLPHHHLTHAHTLAGFLSKAL